MINLLATLLNCIIKETRNKFFVSSPVTHNFEYLLYKYIGFKIIIINTTKKKS